MGHITGQILGKTVNIDTLYFAWACMALILLVGFWLASGISEDTAKYNTKQHIAEGIYSFIKGIVQGQVGHRADKYVFFIGSIFIFILVNYYAGLLPWKMGSMFEWWPQIVTHDGHHTHHHPWHGASPCADINVPVAMALIVIITYIASGIQVGGDKYIQSFLPINYSSKKGFSINAMCIIEIMDLFVRPLTLSLRLFANTVAGETLLSTFVSLTVLVIPVVVLGFELFVGLLQAFLFTILSTVYIGVAIHHAEHLVHQESH